MQAPNNYFIFSSIQDDAGKKRAEFCLDCNSSMENADLSSDSPSPFLGFFWDFCGIFMGFLWEFVGLLWDCIGIFMVSYPGWPKTGIFVGFFLGFYRIFVGLHWNTYWMCSWGLTQKWDFFGIFLEFCGVVMGLHLEFYGIALGYLWGMFLVDPKIGFLWVFFLYSII